MGSIPLPSLDIRPPENPLDQYAKALSIKSMIGQQDTQKLQQTGLSQENQLRQQSINDQQAVTKAMQEWDGKSYEDLLPLVIKHGGSSNAVIGLKSQVLAQQEKLSTIAKNDAETGGKNLETQQKHNDMLLGHLDAATAVPDDQLIDQVKTEKNAALMGGYLDKQHADMLDQLLATGDPKKIRGALDIFTKGLTGQKEQFDQAAKQAESYKNIQQGNLAKAEALMKGSPLTAMENDPSHFAGEKLPASIAYLQSKIAEPNGDPADKARATRLLATAQTAQKIQLSMDASKKATEQAITQGSPTAAAQLLISGDATLSQLKARGSTPEFIAKTLTEAHRLSGGQFNAQKAEADFDVAKSSANVGFFGSAKSLTDKGGTLDQLADAAKNIPAHSFKPFNSIEDVTKAAMGSGPLAKYAAIAVGTADDYSKVMGAGAGSDASRLQAINLIGAALTPAERQGAIEGIRGAVNSQKISRIGSNPVLKKMYGDQPSSGGQFTITLPNGKSASFPSQAAADAFKKEAGIQ